MWIGIKTSAVTSKSIDGTVNENRSTVENMAAHHGRFTARPADLGYRDNWMLIRRPGKVIIEMILCASPHVLALGRQRSRNLK